MKKMKSARKQIYCAAAAFVMSVLPHCSHADPIIYATAGAGTSLVRIDVATQKVSTLGIFGVPGADAIAINDKGETFTVTHGWPPGGNSQLARVDLATGQATAFGTLNRPENFMGLGFAPDGTLYGVNAGSGTPAAGSLYRFDPATGVATKVGVSGGCFDIMDLAWHPGGTMYGAVNDSLYRVEPTTGQATLLTRIQGVSRVMGLAIDRVGVFYLSEIVTNAPLLRVDPVTGATTKLFDTGVDFIHGLDTAPIAAPVIRATPTLQPQAVYLGRRVSFAVSATGLSPLIFQWRFNGQDLAGQTNKALTIAAAQPAHEGDYAVEVSNPGGTTVSHSVRLWVVPTNEFRKFIFTNAANARLPYLMRFPLDYDPARRYPLVVKLYGSPWHEGVLPAEFWNWPRVAVEGSYERQTRDPVIHMYPTQRREVAGSDWTAQEVKLIAELLDWIVTQFPIDKDRVYVRGGSISLWASVELLRLRHDRVAAATLVSGDVTADPVLNDLPLWTLQTLQEGIGVGAFAQQLRTFGGQPIHTEFKSASHADVAAAGNSPVVVEWLMAQRRGQPAMNCPVVTIDRIDPTPVHRTGATKVTLIGSVDAFGGNLTGLAWNNGVTRSGSNLTVTNSWIAPSIPLAAEKTNIIVVTAAVDAARILGQAATTAFSDTLFVFSTPLRLSLNLQGDNAILDWTGGVPPFALQGSPTVDAPSWNEVFSNVTPPVTVPAPGPTHFYRVTGQ